MDFPDDSDRDDSWGQIQVILGKGLPNHGVGSESDGGLISGASVGSLLNISVPRNFYDRNPGDVELIFKMGSDSGPILAKATARSASAVPPAPTGVSATADDTDSITVSWRSVSGARKYWLQRAIRDSGPWTPVSSEISGSSHSADRLTENTRYYFRVLAYGDGTAYASDWGEPSQPVSAYTHFQFTAKPIRPGDTSTNTWTVPPGVTGVYLEASFPENSSREEAWGDIQVILGKGLPNHNVGSESDDRLVSGASAGSLLNISVPADFYDRSAGDVELIFKMGSDSGPILAKATARSRSPKPPAPTEVSARTGDVNDENHTESVTVTWKGGDGINNYRLQEREGKLGSWATVVSQIPINSTSHTVTGLMRGTSYYFRVLAHGDGTTYAQDWGEPSEAAWVYTRFLFSPEPIRPGHESGSPWQVPEEASTLYLEVRFSQESDREDSWRDIEITLTSSPRTRFLTRSTRALFSHSIGSDSDSVSLNSSGSNAEVNISVPREFYDRAPGKIDLAFKLNNRSGPVLAKATVRSASPPPPAPPPTGLRATAKNPSSIEVSWDAGTQGEIGKYSLEHKKRGTVNWQVVDANISNSSTSYPVTSLDPATVYDFRLSAYGDGDPYSSEESSQPSSTAWAATHFHFNDLATPLGPKERVNLWSVPTGIASGVYLQVEFPAGSTREDQWSDLRLILGKGFEPHIVAGDYSSGPVPGVSGESLINISIPADFYNSVAGTVPLTFRLGGSSGPVLAVATVRTKEELRFDRDSFGPLTFNIGSEVNSTLPNASGGYGKLSYTMTRLPSGLTFLDDEMKDERRITDTPTVAESRSVTYTVTDKDDDTNTLTFMVIVENKLDKVTGFNVVPLPKRMVLIAWEPGPNHNLTNVEYDLYAEDASGAVSKAIKENVTNPTVGVEIKTDAIIDSSGLTDHDYFRLWVMARDTAVTNPMSNSDDSEMITINDSPIISIDGNNKPELGQPEPARDAGKAVVKWLPENDAASFALRWRKLESDSSGGSHTHARWELDSSSLPAHKSENTSAGAPMDCFAMGVNTAEIGCLELEAVYAVQLNYTDANGQSVFSARDYYVWPSARPAVRGERVASFPLTPGPTGKDISYVVCEDTFVGASEAERDEWVPYVNHAFKQWEIATGDLGISISHQLNENDERVECADYSEFVDEIVNGVVRYYAEQMGMMIAPSPGAILAHADALMDKFFDDGIKAARHQELMGIDEALNEVLMFDDVTNDSVLTEAAFREISERVGHGWCSEKAAGCVSRVWKKGVVVSSDIKLRRRPHDEVLIIDYYPNYSSTATPEKNREPNPGDVQFNYCGAAHLAYNTLVHEAGHLLGIGYGYPVLGIEQQEHHPRLDMLDAAMSYESWPFDCSPQPLDILALYALYQTEN